MSTSVPGIHTSQNLIRLMNDPYWRSGNDIEMGVGHNHGNL